MLLWAAWDSTFNTIYPGNICKIAEPVSRGKLLQMKWLDRAIQIVYICT